jgi:hypothetical protein
MTSVCENLHSRAVFHLLALYFIHFGIDSHVRMKVSAAIFTGMNQNCGMSRVQKEIGFSFAAKCVALDSRLCVHEFLLL